MKRGRTEDPNIQRAREIVWHPDVRKHWDARSLPALRTALFALIRDAIHDARLREPDRDEEKPGRAP